MLATAASRFSRFTAATLPSATINLDQRDLAMQVRLALRRFARLRIAIAGWTTFDHVGDVNVVPALEFYRAEHVVEEFARLSYERLALGIFLRARAFGQQAVPA